MAHPKGVLLERAAKLGFERPEFRTEQTGPEHEPQFLSDVIVAGEVLGTGQGGSKRTAESRAAEEALAQLDAREDGGKGARPAEPATDRKQGKGAGKRSGGQKDDGGKKQAARQEARQDQRKSQHQDKRKDQRPERRPSEAAAQTAPQATEPVSEEAQMAEDSFDGPWPLFDDLLAAALQVAERRVSGDLRGDDARIAIRDFSLTLYKEMLSDLGEVVDEDDDEDAAEDD